MITKTMAINRIERTYLAVLIVSLLLAIALFMTPIHEAYALPVGDTITVTSDADSGAGSLRAAITTANGNGNSGEQDVIRFAIPVGSEPDKEVVSESTLTISEPVLIDGYTQGDAEENDANWPEPFNGTLRIAINSNNSNGGVVVNSNDVTLRGLTINGSPTTEIDVSGSDNFVLEGSFIGIGVIGYDNLKNSNNVGGVTIDQSDNIRIGGGLAAERNVMGYCMEACIEISGTSVNTSTDPVIQGNYIGTGIDSITPMPSPTIGGTGIVINRYVENPTIGGDSGAEGNTINYNTHGALWVSDVDSITVQGNRILGNKNWNSDGNGIKHGGGIHFAGVTNGTIGGESDQARNIIAGNDGSITLADSTSTNAANSNIFIENNYIGVMDDGTTPYPNYWSGVFVDDASHTILIKDNIISNSLHDYNDSTDGVAITGTAQKVAIISNSIYNNENLGIDINDNDNIETNDVGDGDTGPNGVLNYPTYYETSVSGGNTTINYSYDGAVGDYIIEFFSNTVLDDSGQGEGETLIGSTSITKLSGDTQGYSITIPGTNHENISLTATEIDDESTTGYGATSEFGGEGDPPPPVVDVAAEKRLLNPEDVALGEVLEYEITIRNDGPDSIDIGPYDASTPGLNQLFIDIMPPQITYSGASGNNIGCSSLGAGSAGPMLGGAIADHADHEMVFCGWTGGSNILETGESVTAVVSATIVDDSNLNFRNYVAGFVNDYDPDKATTDAVYATGNDILTEYEELGNNTVNNIYWTDTTIADVSVLKVLTNPQDVTPGATLAYDVTFFNAGPEPADLTYYNGGGANPIGTALFVDVMPPNLTYLSNSNPDISCNVAGPASITPYFANHSTHNLILCAYTGAETELTAGQSITTTISAEVTDSVEESFTNYILSGIHPNDPDYLYMYYNYFVSASNALSARGEGDMIDILGTTDRNYSFAAFTVEELQGPGGNNGNGPGSGSGGNSGSNNNSLAETGINVLLMMVASVLIGTLLVTTVVYAQRVSLPYSPK